MGEDWDTTGDVEPPPAARAAHGEESPDVADSVLEWLVAAEPITADSAREGKLKFLEAMCRERYGQFSDMSDPVLAFIVQAALRGGGAAR